MILCLAVLNLRQQTHAFKIPREDIKFYNYVVQYSEKYNIDPMLTTAIINVESNFNRLAVSKAGAMGLMQLMPAIAERYKVEDPFNPEDNIEGGVKYFKFLMKLFGHKIHLALAAYNAGHRAVTRYKGIPPYKETKRYVKKVIKKYLSYIKISNNIYRIVGKDGTYIFTDNPRKFIVYDN